ARHDDRDGQARDGRSRLRRLRRRRIADAGRRRAVRGGRGDSHSGWALARRGEHGRRRRRDGLRLSAPGLSADRAAPVVSGASGPARTDADLAREVAWAGRILAMGGHGDYTLGHVSARSADGRHVLMKPNGLGLEEVTPADILTLDFAGARVAGTGRIHLEAVLHTAVYRARPDVGAVVHTHPPYTTA